MTEDAFGRLNQVHVYKCGYTIGKRCTLLFQAGTYVFGIVAAMWTREMRDQQQNRVLPSSRAKFYPSVQFLLM